MNRRFRLVAALLALVALSAYFAESVMASWCMPGPETANAAEGELSAPAPHAGMHHAPAGAETDSHDTDGSRSNAPRCPLGMAGAGSTCVAVSLPARADVEQTASTIEESSILAIDRSQDLLLVASHFRPPRA